MACSKKVNGVFITGIFNFLFITDCVCKSIQYEQVTTQTSSFNSSGYFIATKRKRLKKHSSYRFKKSPILININLKNDITIQWCWNSTNRQGVSRVIEYTSSSQMTKVWQSPVRSWSGISRCPLHIKPSGYVNLMWVAGLWGFSEWRVNFPPMTKMFLRHLGKKKKNFNLGI